MAKLRFMKLTITLGLMTLFVNCSNDDGGGDDPVAPSPATTTDPAPEEPTPAPEAPAAETPAADPTPTDGGTANDGATTDPAPTQPTDTGLTNSLILGEVKGQILPKSGTPEAIVANATVTAISRPDVVGKTDAEGNFQISNITPGALTLLVTANNPAGLNLVNSTGPAAYGLSFPDLVVISGESTDVGQAALKETGSISGTIGYYDNPNNLDLTGIEVFIPGTSFIAKTDAQGEFSLQGVPEGTYDLRIQQTGFSVIDLDAIEVEEASETDIGTPSLSLSNGPEGGIAVTANVTKTISGAVAKISTSRTVGIVLDYDSDAALMKISDEPSFLNKSWVPVKTNASWTFTSDGKKTLFVQYSDLNGLESSPFSADIYVDTTAPVMTSIKILRGWTQIATLDAFIDIEAADGGAGIESIMFSNDSNAFSSGEAWVDYTGSRMDWTLKSGADGVRNVYVKVRDYAGFESTVATDSINKGSSTLVLAKDYSEDLYWSASRSPFELTGDTDFSGKLEIQEGVTVNALTYYMRHKGLTVLDGGNTGITINEGWHRFNAGEPGVSQNYIVKNVNFAGYREMFLNGGTFENCTFSANSAYGATINKYGVDNLVFKANTLTQIVGFVVFEGNGNTRFEGNTADAMYLIRQNGGNGTVSIGNTFTRGASTFPAIAVVDGTLTSTDDDLTGSKGGDIHFQADASSNDATLVIQNPTMADCTTAFNTVQGGSNEASLTVNGGTVNNCDTLAITGSATSGISISNLTATNINIAAHSNVGATDTVTIDNSNISVTQAFYKGDDWGGGVAITDSILTCEDDGSTICDFAFMSDVTSPSPAASISISNSKIICNGDADSGCRGFTSDQNTAAGATWTLSIDNNFWTGDKAMVTDLSTGVRGSPLTTLDASNIRAYNDGYTLSGLPNSITLVSDEASLTGVIGPE